MLWIISEFVLLHISCNLRETQNEKAHFINPTYVQTWPVRTPRPVAAKLPADTPLLTGQVTILPFLFKLGTLLVPLECLVT